MTLPHPLPDTLACGPTEHYALQPKQGWFQIAFTDEVAQGISSWSVGRHRFILVREGDAIRGFAADCPHRGAHLGIGGRIAKGAIICPFHGYEVALGDKENNSRFCAKAYPVLVFGGMVFLRLSDERDYGLAGILTDLAKTYVFVKAFRIQVRAPMALVIENGYDAKHFAGVHGIDAQDLVVDRHDNGGLRVRGTFLVPQQRNEHGEAKVEIGPVPYEAITFSPGLIILRLGGEAPYGVVTGATDRGDGYCDVRLTYVFPTATYGQNPDPESYAALTKYSLKGLEGDTKVWENMASGFTPSWVKEDGPVLVYQRFCREFC